MPLGQSGKHYYNPNVMKAHGDMPTHEQGGMMHEHPKSIHGHFHEDGTAHTHVHHADDSHEHMDHGSHEEAHDHMNSMMQGEGSEGNEEQEEPEMSKGMAHNTDSGAY